MNAVDDYFGEDLPEEYYEAVAHHDFHEWDDYGSTIEAAAIDDELATRAQRWAA